MSDSRAKKRSKTATYHQSVYRDTIPLFDDFTARIHSSDGALRNIGGSSRASGTRIERSSHYAFRDWRQLSTWSPPDDANFALDPDDAQFNDVVEADITTNPPPLEKKKKKRSKVSKRPHVVWKELHRQEYLEEIIRWAGRGDFREFKTCSDCLARRVEEPGLPVYRCKECAVPDLTCGACCVKRHRLHPFHRIQEWKGDFFADTSLKSLGLTLQLNHSGNFCENPIDCHANMLVLHVNGIHSVAIRYCGCARQIPFHLQLLRRRLYPASQRTPQTCATFELLRHLHLMALTTKASTYDFYQCLEKSTNNTGINPSKSRYRALLRMLLQWRHLQMLKWAGRGQVADGVAATATGELAVRCPTCPHPGVNLPADWEDAPLEMQFLYMMIICMDANFRLKNQLVSNYSQDPGLGIGWAYMVPRHPYESYVMSRADDKDISTCVGFQALAKANTKFSTGLRYTGVNLTVCGRSEMILPAGVGNLQKGERYANMDYIFGSALRFVLVSMVLISYDIACQWYINLFKRIEHWPPEIIPPVTKNFAPAIPKLHEPMHQTANHHGYSLNFIPGVRLSDCECPERVWGPHNALGNSTKTQGPGSRHDVIDDNFGFWNWLKYIFIGLTLLRRYKSAVAQRNIQAEGFRGLSNSLDPGLVKKWEAMCVEWEQDKQTPKKKKNPYQTKSASLSEAQTCKELAEEEAHYLQDGGSFPHTTTSSTFVTLGLELEEAQRRLRRIANNMSTNSTIRQEGTLSEQRNRLWTRIRAWEQLLPIYLPGLLQYQTDLPPSSTAAPTSTNAEDAMLWFPSAILEANRPRVCSSGLVEIESRMRLAQMEDSLNEVRRILKVKARMIQFKNKNIRGQRDGTRSRAVIDRVHEKARAAASKYRAARSAYMTLVGPGEWETRLRVLEDGDIRGYQDPSRLRTRMGRKGTLEDDQVQQEEEQEEAGEQVSELSLLREVRSRRDGTGETRRTLSWIWTVGNIAGPKDDQDDILQVEWAKSRARMMRAKEEVMLLKEEMRRALAFLEWKAKWWRDRQHAWEGADKALAEGILANATAQAALQDDLASHFRALWKAPLQDTPTDGSNAEHTVDETDDDDDDDEEEDEEVDEEGGGGTGNGEDHDQDQGN